MNQNSGNLGRIAVGTVIIFVGFLLVTALVIQAITIESHIGILYISDIGIFSSIVFLSLILVSFGGFVVGKYVEKRRSNKSSHPSLLPQT
jgi:hypothetical protein